MPQIENGQGLDVSVPQGQSIAIATVTGTYSATVISGTSAGTVLATASDAGGTFGPYASGATVRLSAGLNSCVAYEVGDAPVVGDAPPAKYALDPTTGNVTGLVGPGGDVVLGGAGYANTIVLDGDSITARYAESTAGTSNSSYFAWFNAYMQQAFTVVGTTAVSGQNSTQCLARFDDNVAPLKPKWVSLMIGINDIGTPDDVIANIGAYITKVRNIGAKLLLWTVLPSSGVAATQAKRRGWSLVNAYITSLAGVSNDVVVIPAHDAWLDSAFTTAGAYAPVAAYVQDGTHPTALGAQVIGLYAYRTLSSMFQQRVIPAAIAVPLGHKELTTNPRANDATTASPTAPLTGTLPAYWGASRESGSAMGGALSVIARADGFPGKTARFAFSGAATAERCIVKAGNRGVGGTISNGGSAVAYARYKHPTNTSIELIATASGTFSASAVADTANLVVGDVATVGVQVYATEPIVVGGTYQAFAECQFEAGGSGAVQPMLSVAIQDSGFSNLLLVAALSTDGSAYGGITATQDTTPMLIASRPFVMPSGAAWLDIGLRLWSAAGSSGALLVKSCSIVRIG